MWQRSPDIDGNGTIDAADKLTYADAPGRGAELAQPGGYNDWRLPTIKELYSLIDFSGTDPERAAGGYDRPACPSSTRDVFEFGYGDTAAGERIIDAQYASSTLYVSTDDERRAPLFGVNFADGRIKGYPTAAMPGRTEARRFYVHVRPRQPGLRRQRLRRQRRRHDHRPATGLMW